MLDGDRLTRLKSLEPSADVAAAYILYVDLLNDIERSEQRHSYLDFETRLAGALRDAGLLMVARSIFQRVLALDGNRVWALLGLSLTLKKLGEHRAALELARKANLLDSTNRVILTELAGQLVESGARDEAVQLLEAALAKRPGDGPLSLALARIVRDSDPERDERLLLDVIASDDPAAEAFSELAKRALDSGDAGRALELTGRGLARFPADLWLLLTAARAHAGAGDRDAAVALCERATAVAPRSAWPYIQKASITFDSGSHEEALSIVDRVANSVSSDNLGLIAVKRAELLGSLARWPEALSCLPKDPSNFLVWKNTVVCHLKLGDLPRAAALLAEPLPKETRGFYGKWLQGQYHELAGELDRAQQAYENSYQDRPNKDAAYGVARLSLQSNLMTRCAEYLEKYARLEALSQTKGGRTVRASQNLLGQLLDEARADRGLVARLAGIGEISAASIPDLRAVMVDFPENTVAAITYLHALRRGGRLRLHRSGADEPRRIPRRIVQYWEGPIDPTIEQNISECRRLHEGYEHVLLNDRLAFDFIKERFGRDVARKFSRLESAAARADLVRLAYVSDLGGIYLDADDRAFVGLDELVPLQDEAFFYVEDIGSIGNNFFAASPGSRIISEALTLAIEAMMRGDRDLVWLRTGPGLLSRAVGRAIAGDPDATSNLSVATLAEVGSCVGMHAFAHYKRGKSWWLSEVGGR